MAALTCPQGHLTETLAWATPPKRCPHCPGGKPCRLPLAEQTSNRRKGSS